MDLGMIIGLVAAFGSLATMVLIEHQSFGSLLLAGPVIFVLGATISVGVAGSTLTDAIDSFKAIPSAFRGKRPDFTGTVDTLIELADKARQRGLLSLEDEASDLDDPFLAVALQGVADGTDSEDLRILLEDHVATWSKSRRTPSAFFSGLGGYAPTIGIVGTVVSLTHVLANLSTPDKLGPLIASAFVATLWGLLSANFIWLPLGTRLRRLADLEVERMSMIIEGVLAIQAGTASRALGERLKAMVPYAAKRSRAEGKNEATAPLTEANAPLVGP
jgi:chemotaxis protein MotA